MYIKARHFHLDKIKSTSDRTPHGFEIQTKADGWSYLLLRRPHLKFQVISTTFDLVLTSNGKIGSKSSAFLENQKVCPPICTNSHQVFYRKIRPKCVQNCQEEHKRKKNKKTGKRLKIDDQTCPMVTATMGAWSSVTLEI